MSDHRTSVKKQKSLKSFFSISHSSSSKATTAPVPLTKSTTTIKKRVRRHSETGSHFHSCPLCNKQFPIHQLEIHASDCNGLDRVKNQHGNNDTKQDGVYEESNHNNDRALELVESEDDDNQCHSEPKENASEENVILSFEPIPGLYVIENFITEEEESIIVKELDGKTYSESFLPWKEANFNGKHCGKRWGVHCNLRERKVTEAENSLPHFMETILIPKLKQLLRRSNHAITTSSPSTTTADFLIPSNVSSTWVPNEANAINYCRQKGDYLKSHVDDRQLSKEIIANLSLAGDCYMTFKNVAVHRNNAVTSKKILLRRRCIQLLTGKARYDFSHCISNEDILSDRRISITMRESPLTEKSIKSCKASTALNMNSQQPAVTTEDDSEKWWKKRRVITPTTKQSDDLEIRHLQPIPGLYVFENFITEEEELIILKEIDTVQPEWILENHTGLHREKRWGVDHDLWSPTIRPAKYNIPYFMQSIIIPKLQQLSVMQSVIPNEINSIDYRRKQGHSLAAHVDDRSKHKEPIANLSLAGDCFLSFNNQKVSNNLLVQSQKVLLKRRTLFVMTGRVRYDFSHGIDNCDLLSDRRVSLTMRQMAKDPPISAAGFFPTIKN